MQELMAETLDRVAEEIAEIQRAAREDGMTERPSWLMIVLRTPKGWTGPKEVDGLPAENWFRSHQVPLSNLATNPDHLHQLEEWLRSYRPEELFDEHGALRGRAGRAGAARHPSHGRHSAGQRWPVDPGPELPDFRESAAPVTDPATMTSEATRVQGRYLCDVLVLKADEANFRLFGPDETASNRLSAVFQATDRTWQAECRDTDDHLAPRWPRDGDPE
jgi:xylulose-5-phosphate/fructose-6-phosphate phosphoketolase